MKWRNQTQFNQVNLINLTEFICKWGRQVDDESLQLICIIKWCEKKGVTFSRHWLSPDLCHFPVSKTTRNWHLKSLKKTFQKEIGADWPSGTCVCLTAIGWDSRLAPPPVPPLVLVWANQPLLGAFFKLILAVQLAALSLSAASATGGVASSSASHPPTPYFSFKVHHQPFIHCKPYLTSRFLCFMFYIIIYTYYFFKFFISVYNL